MRTLGQAVCRGALLGCLALLGLTPSPALAQSRSELVAVLYAEFDARSLSDTDKRLLQLGLTLDGSYVGLLDGRWGAGSQTAIEQLVARTDPRSAADGLVRNYHIATLASWAMDFIVANGLAYRGGSPWLHRFLSPSGPFIPDTETQGIDDLTVSSGGVTINVLTSGFPFAADLHISIANRLLQHQQPYIVRNATRMVTAQGLGSPRIYVRSDVSSDGLTWFTTLIGENTGADPRLFDVIAASISLDPTAEIYAPNGRLASLVAADTAFASLPPEPIAPISPEPVTAPPEQPSGDEGGEISGAGTAFFVNNTDLVTAKHVVEDCARVTFDDGTQLTVVSEDQTLDLALLTSPQRSRDWIPVHLTGKAQLGQRIVALGYPFYGELGTALNSTGGDVSALTGLGDDPDVITISAPIHPGNSGGPLLGVDGTVIGVVVATIDKLAVATATGNIPENINFAVTGEKLLAFLESEGVSLPRQEADAVDFDTGIPESMQRAVVPIICEGS